MRTFTNYLGVSQLQSESPGLLYGHKISQIKTALELYFVVG